ncbi:MAG: oligopeptidase B, partial [Gammaproteobacteria bacterium]|nr:oligopeptidase B [Gammaproteobacteria bacterium]
MSQHTSKQNPPIAPAHPHTHNIHSDQRTDPYFWLKDRNDPAVTAYIEAENTYAESWLKHTEPLREDLVKEM